MQNDDVARSRTVGSRRNPELVVTTASRSLNGRYGSRAGLSNSAESAGCPDLTSERGRSRPARRPDGAPARVLRMSPLFMSSPLRSGESSGELAYQWKREPADETRLPPDSLNYNIRRITIGAYHEGQRPIARHPLASRAVFSKCDVHHSFPPAVLEERAKTTLRR